MSPFKVVGWLLMMVPIVGHSARAEDSTCKPRAPVTLRLEARALGGSRWEVSLHAVPTGAADSLRLELAGASRDFGVTASNQERTLTTRIILRPPGGDVVGVARLGPRGRAVSIHLGGGEALRATPAPQTVTLPGGERVAQTRP